MIGSNKDWPFDAKAVAKTRVWKINIETFHGKRSGL